MRVEFDLKHASKKSTEFLRETIKKSITRLVFFVHFIRLLRRVFAHNVLDIITAIGGQKYFSPHKLRIGNNDAT
jgi:disulfide oxidoreductase YuzD